jgi:hypothetical protein
MSTVRILLMILFSAWSLSMPFGILWAASDPGNPGILEIKDPDKYDRVVAISDVHAQYGTAEELLRAYDLIDENGRWSGGKTLFVVVGDTLNKGRKSLKLLDLWIRLQGEAERAGGRLVHTLGNHEASLLARDESFFSHHPELADDLKDHDLTLDQFLHRGGKRGRFLHRMPAGVRVGDVLFIHSGVPPDMSWAEFVRSAKEGLRAGRYDSKFLLGKNSILNSSGWADDPEKVAEISRRMKKMGLTTIVFGHDSSAFGEIDKIEGMKLIERGEGSQLLVKIDTGVGKGVSDGRLLFFDTPAQMNGERPPADLRYSSRKMTKTKPLQPCENFYVLLKD